MSEPLKLDESTASRTLIQSGTLSWTQGKPLIYATVSREYSDELMDDLFVISTPEGQIKLNAKAFQDMAVWWMNYCYQAGIPNAAT
jgi:hypothetical protein